MGLQTVCQGIAVAGRDGQGQMKAQGVAIPDVQQRITIGQPGRLTGQQIADIDRVQPTPSLLHQHSAIPAAHRIFVGFFRLTLGQHPAL